MPRLSSNGWEPIWASKSDCESGIETDCGCGLAFQCLRHRIVNLLQRNALLRGKLFARLILWRSLNYLAIQQPHFDRHAAKLRIHGLEFTSQFPSLRNGSPYA